MTATPQTTSLVVPRMNRSVLGSSLVSSSSARTHLDSLCSRQKKGSENEDCDWRLGKDSSALIDRSGVLMWYAQTCGEERPGTQTLRPLWRFGWAALRS